MASVSTNVLNYNDYVTQIAALAVYNVSTVAGIVRGDANFETIVPQLLNYAELRIQRDADLLPLQTSGSYTLTTGSNVLAIPTADFVTIQTVSVTANGVPTPLLPASKEFIQNVWGDPTALATPQVFAMYGGDAATAGNTTTNIIVGPYPDANYVAPVTGTIRMPSLYKFSDNGTDASTMTTFISAWLPDLLLMASMIFISGYQRNFGRQSDDPQMSVSYESQYQALLKGVQTEEARKRFAAGAWSSMGPTPLATPSR